MDILFVLLTLGFFTLSWGFARLCAALEPAREEKRWTASTSSACWWRSAWPSTCSWPCSNRSAS